MALLGPGLKEGGVSVSRWRGPELFPAQHHTRPLCHVLVPGAVIQQLITPMFGRKEQLKPGLSHQEAACNLPLLLTEGGGRLLEGQK